MLKTQGLIIFFPDDDEVVVVVAFSFSAFASDFERSRAATPKYTPDFMSGYSERPSGGILAVGMPSYK